MSGDHEDIEKRILVIRIGRLGDTVLATPVIEVLQQVFGPAVVIDFVASPGASTAILEMDRRIRKVFPVNRRRLPWRLHPVKQKLKKHSRAVPYDLVINLECGSECDDFHGFLEYGEFCGRPVVQPRHISGRHCVDTEKTIYSDRLGPKITAEASPSLSLESDPEFSLAFDGPGIVLFNPGFSGIRKSDYRSHRAWPVQHWTELIVLIRQRLGLTIAINGTNDERKYFEQLLDLPGTLSLFGTPLRTLVQALEKARCMVSVDTGTMHLATALGTPVVALFGPTIPELTGPYSSKAASRILTSGIDCQPCQRTPEQKTCTLNRCMQALKPELVYTAVEQVIR